MSIVTRIQNALRELDPAGFQRLCDVYLRERGYERLNPIGLVIGTDKVRRGTPDSLVVLPSGRYAFVESTTQVDGVGAKFLADVGKCFDEAKTGIPVERIEEVVLCHTSVLSPEEEHALITLCQTHGCRLNTFGIGPIAYDLYQKYPGLARDFLGVEVDTGQIVSPHEFVERYGQSALATPLDTEFAHRDAEMRSALDALEAGRLLLVAGKAGVGKTRFALEVCRRHAEAHPGLETQCVYYKGADLFEDVRTHFARPGRYLVLVDDANRVSGFEYVLQLLHEQRDDRVVSIVATVREYALGKVRDAVRPYGGGALVDLGAMSEDEIRTLVRRAYGIEDWLYLERITEIARGNPRLAHMAGRVATRESTLASIADVSSLYDEYYRSVRDDLRDLGERALLQAAGILAFFRVVDRSNAEQMAEIAEAFGVAPDEFWRAVLRLHDLELVDCHENEVVKIADQVLATYLFYLAFFRARALDVGALVGRLFPQYRARLFDALNPVLSAFDAKGVTDHLRPLIRARWHALEAEGDAAALLTFVEAFGPVDETATLRYVRDRARCEPPTADLAGQATAIGFLPAATVPSPSLYSVLAPFAHAGLAEARMALELLLDLVERRPHEIPHALHVLQKRFGLTHHAHLRGFEIQRAAIDALWRRATDDRGKDGKGGAGGVASGSGSPHLVFAWMLLAVAGPLLRTDQLTTESASDHAVTITRFDLPATDDLETLRRAIWERVWACWRTPPMRPDVVEFLHAHADDGFHVADADMLAVEAGIVLPAVDASFDPAEFSHCAAARAYLDLLRQHEVSLDEPMAATAATIGRRLTNPTFALAVLLIEEFDDLRERIRLPWEEHQRLREKRLRAYVRGFDRAAYATFFARCGAVLEAVGVRARRRSTGGGRDAETNREHYQVRQGAAEVLAWLAHNDPALLGDVLADYLSTGNPLRLRPARLVATLVETSGATGAHEFLASREFAHRDQWIFAWYAALPAGDGPTDAALLPPLERLYRSADPVDLPMDVAYLGAFEAIDPLIVPRMIGILVDRSADDTRIGHVLRFAVDVPHEAVPALRASFGRRPEDVELLARAYLAMCNADPHADHDAEIFDLLFDLGASFAERWVDWIYGQKERVTRRDDQRDYSRLWRRSDHAVPIRRVVERIYEHEHERGRFWGFDRYAMVWFRVRDAAADASDVRRCQDVVLQALIAERHADADFMAFLFRSVVVELPPERRLACIAAFVSRDPRFEVFDALPLEPSHWSARGSWVPVLRSRVEFLESLLPVLDTVDLLEHRAKVEAQIVSRRAEMERERRRDFLGEE